LEEVKDTQLWELQLVCGKGCLEGGEVNMIVRHRACTHINNLKV